MAGARKTGFVEEKARYYDRHIPKNLNLDPYWRRLYKRVITYLGGPKETISIADLGCSTGSFAKTLYNKGYKNYVGIDFSATCIERARRRVPSFQFVVANLYDEGLQETFGQYDVFICLQIFEHLVRDLNIVKAIPSGKRIILSVPNTSGRGHVRVFGGLGEVERRYSSLINFKAISSVYRGRGKVYFFVGHGVRK